MTTPAFECHCPRLWRVPVIFVYLAFGAVLGMGWSGCSANRGLEDVAAVGESGPVARVFQVRGVVKSVRADEGVMVVQHEVIPNYMAAMTMPFRVRDRAALRSVSPGDSVEFPFHVGSDESWVERVVIVRKAAEASPGGGASQDRTAAGNLLAQSGFTNGASERVHPLMEERFTNQLGQAVSLAGLRGRALAITFFFTRCPVPDYCPRLSRNFQEAAAKLSAMAAAPTNWHLISVTIDPEFDTPSVLKAYGERYRASPAQWSFWTGRSEQVAALARESGVTVEPGAGLFTHNFRTLIVGTNGQLQTSIPIGGPISDGIVEELLQAMGGTGSGGPPNGPGAGRPMPKP